MCSKITNLIKQPSEIITYCIIIILMILILIIFFKVDITYNEVTYHSIIGWGLENNTIFASLEVGLLSFLATIYTNNRSIKLMKLTLTGDTIKLKSQIEDELLLHRLYEKLNQNDEILTFLNIFDLIDKNDSEFKIIAPQSQSKLIKFLTIRIEELDKNLTNNETTANIIILDLIKLCINRKENKICVKELSGFDELWDSSKFNEEYQFEPNKKNLKELINKINDNALKNETIAIFNEYCELCKDVIKSLEKELKKLD